VETQPSQEQAQLESQLRTLAAALLELYALLEEYAPTWYTEQHHNRAEAALRTLLDTPSTPFIQ